MNSYVFILCPPFSGSTVLWQLLSTSSAVSALPTEGQFMPDVKDIMRHKPWKADLTLHWPRIKAVWDQYWDCNKPLWIEKSPPNLIRTNEILKFFKPVYFIIMVRNPYAHCDGLIRRTHMSPQQAAKFSVRCLKQQAENAQRLTDSISFTYESLTEDPARICQKLQAALPALGKLQPNASFRAQTLHGPRVSPLINMNPLNIRNLSRGELNIITPILAANVDVLNYWGYDLHTPTIQHDLQYVNNRTRLMIRRTYFKGKKALRRMIGK